MARSATMLLLLVSCAVFATAVYAGGDCSGTQRRTFEFFEHEGKENLVFSASEENGNVGSGYVYDFLTTKTYDPKSEQYGYTGGLYYIVHKGSIQEVSTTYFEDIGEEGGTFANAEIHLRGVWKQDSDGNDLERQELSIVGGQKGLAGAYGTVVYTKVGKTVWLVQGVLYLDSCGSKSAHISQVVNA